MELPPTANVCPKHHSGLVRTLSTWPFFIELDGTIVICRVPCGVPVEWRRERQPDRTNAGFTIARVEWRRSRLTPRARRARALYTERLRLPRPARKGSKSSFPLRFSEAFLSELWRKRSGMRFRVHGYGFELSLGFRSPEKVTIGTCPEFSVGVWRVMVVTIRSQLSSDLLGGQRRSAQERSQCSFSYSLLLLLECSSWPTRCSLERGSHGSIRWTGHVKRRSGTGDLNPGDGLQCREVRLLQFLSATVSLSVTSQLDCTRTTGHQSPAKPVKDKHHESLSSRTQSVFLLSLSFPTKMFPGTHPAAAGMPPHYRSSWYH